ncbi:YlxR family protein [Mycoplasmopsis gallinarum]|uniref:YlxR domain-containing protein n=1 Tax=Mycoplasmopsis gallinarum TaxID=29557 RepID=A0A168RJY9_9BACT|nr:YlxR family protein [Mycoplasmopsis gallinarum]OAB49054.1 hypothetical protein MGALLINA_00890 [Mycoplasmopsis gallinarum]
MVSNQIYSTSELIRFNYDKNSKEISLDLNNLKKNRGAYFYPSKENWEKICATKALNRVFRTNVSRETYKSIQEQLEELVWTKTKE